MRKVKIQIRQLNLLIILVNTTIIRLMKDKKEILQEIKELLVAHFGRDIKDVILFGSRATGKAHKNSDYDVLIVLNRNYDWRYKREVVSVLYEIELEYDIFIDIKVISVNELNNSIKGLHPLYHDAIREGIHV